MKRKKFMIAVVAMVMAATMSMTAFAAGWKQNATGWWWQNDDGTWPANTWQWIDGNHDGVSECYYFGGDGYMLTGITTTDGYTVNGDGAWIIDGFIQTKKQDVPANTSVDVDTNSPSGYNANGFRANYNSPDENEITYDVMQGLNSACSTVFKDATSASDADAAAQLLKNKGYDAYSDGVNAIITIDKYQLGWRIVSGSSNIHIGKIYLY